MNSIPPPYSDHPNYSQSPPQVPGNYHQQMPMPMPMHQTPYNPQPMYPPPQPMPPQNVTIVTQQPSKSSSKKFFDKFKK
jgi:hypothetical protein